MHLIFQSLLHLNWIIPTLQSNRQSFLKKKSFKINKSRLINRWEAWNTTKSSKVIKNLSLICKLTLYNQLFPTKNNKAPCKEEAGTDHIKTPLERLVLLKTQYQTYYPLIHAISPRSFSNSQQLDLTERRGFNLEIMEQGCVELLLQTKFKCSLPRQAR